MRNRTWRTLVVVVATAMALTACSAGETTTTTTDPVGDSGTSSTQESAPAAGNESLTVAFAAEPASLDFSTADGSAIPELLLDNVYETLVRLDASTGEIVPGLATSWEVSDDGTTYDFLLEEGVTFSNGDTFDANSVKASIEYVKSDAWTTNRKVPMLAVERVEVVDEQHVRVFLNNPSRHWLFAMTTRIGSMFTTNALDSLATEAIGTGPYTVGTWNRGDSIQLVRRDDYWSDLPYYETVTFRYFNDASAMSNGLLSGEVDVISRFETPEAISQFEGDEFQIIVGTSNAEAVLAMNNTKEPTNDLRVRQAIRYAIDKEAVAEAVWAGYGALIGAMVPPHDPWYEDLTGDYPYDPDRARELLEEAGAVGATLSYRIPSQPYASKAAQVVQSNLNEVGLNAEIEVLEFPAVWLEEVFRNHDYNLSTIQHNEPRDLTHFANPDYYFQYDNPEVAELFDQADRAATEEEQVELIRQAVRQINEDAAADFLYLTPTLILAREGIQGLPENRITESFDVTGLRE
jgi:peptide/nickel transport system substrate-binding protein